MRQKVLVIIVENYVPGGANKYVEDLVHCLEENFQHIEIWGNRDALLSFDKSRLPSHIKLKAIYISNAGELTKLIPTFPRKIFRILLTPLFFLLNIISLLKMKFSLDSLSPHLVLLCNGGYPASLYLDIAPLFVKPEFYPTMTIVSTPIRKKTIFLRPFWKTIDKIVTIKCKKIITNSTTTKNELIDKYQFPEKKIFILKNGILDQGLIREQVNEVIQIGFISRIEKTKGIEELLGAYEKLKLKHRNIKLVIAGEGSLSPFVAKFALQDPTINYLGHMSSGQNKLLHTVDIFVLPSYQEGLPYSLIEASMAGCAIIASNVGGIPEIIKNNYSGILIPSKSEIALYEALETLISNQDLRTKLAHNARRNFERNLSIEIMQEQAKKIFL